VLICSLREGGQECVSLDLVLSSYSEFTLVSNKKLGGKASIHLAGYLMEDSEGEEEEEEDDGDCCGHDYDHHHHSHEGRNHMCMCSCPRPRSPS